MTITVYTKPQCPQCEQTKKWLDGKGIPYETRDVTLDQEAREYVLGLGYLGAPVVVADGEHWSGFRLDRLKALATDAAA
ncbi:glutaredoxin family protein [Mycolicibacterium thermoresistibile]